MKNHKFDNRCSDTTYKNFKGFPRLSITGNKQQDLKTYDSHK